jgi:cyclophilin family peptidyl-prolyl cis-trans isomerase
MKAYLFLLGIFFSNLGLAEAGNTNPVVIMNTSAGDITIELYPKEAPISVRNFLAYANEGFYNGTIFHRVEKRFVIQGGGFTSQLVKKPNRDPIINESSNGLHNDRWTVAMARTDDPNSATSQFYINLRMNSSLDRGRGKDGYAVFGKVIEGQYVVSDISKRETTSKGSFSSLPLETVIINSVEVKE